MELVRGGVSQTEVSGEKLVVRRTDNNLIGSIMLWSNGEGAAEK